MRVQCAGLILLLGSFSVSLAEPCKERADAVKAAYKHAWHGYVKYAFGHDELHPVSNGYGDTRYDNAN